MTVSGYLDKMETSLADTVHYTLRLNGEGVDMNALIGKHIQLQYKGTIQCMGCGILLKKAYGQGFCFNCLQVSPLASDCIMNPEKCKAHLGVSRDMEWSKGHCLMPHIVYLAFSSQVKVGVTRLLQVPTRWIDQGAISAIKIAELPNRHMAGLMEVFLKKYFSDKTAWQQMLVMQTVGDEVDLNAEKAKAIQVLPAELQKYALNDNSVVEIRYPFIELPSKLTSVGFDKQANIEGTLTAIKGQYLILNNELALNIRKHSGYSVDLLC
jgi:hypothetical protein